MREAKTQNAKRKTSAERSGGFWRALFCVLGFAFCASVAGCYERRQDAVINPDGSGKMLIEGTVSLPATGATAKDKPTAAGYGKLFAADLVNSASGVDAWSDLAITQTADGQAHVAIVAYFSDLNKLYFKQPLELPLQFIWTLEGQEGTLQVSRIHPKQDSGKLDEADARKMVVEAQKEYNEKQRLTMVTQLNAFSMKMIFELPGEVSAANVFDKDPQNKGTVSLTLDGKKVAAALDAFMADGNALQAMFEKGEDTSANDDHLLMSMMNKKGPVSATVKVATVEGEKGIALKPAFDYKTEMRAAELHQDEMFTQAGVELIPQFIVKPAAKPGK